MEESLMGMSTDAIAIFGWAYEMYDYEEIEQKLQEIFDKEYGQPDEDDVTVGMHCCASEPYFFVAAKVVTCSRGDTSSLAPLVNKDVGDMTERLKDFCAKHEIPFKEPQFLLVVWSDQ
jgi:hypothetical protein